jgi:excisionase family DNA binding protein
MPPTTPSAPDMTIQDTAAYMNVSTNHVRNLIADGFLPAYRVGKIIRLRRSEIDAALQRVGA